MTPRSLTWSPDHTLSVAAMMDMDVDVTARTGTFPCAVAGAGDQWAAAMAQGLPCDAIARQLQSRATPLYVQYTWPRGSAVAVQALFIRNLHSKGTLVMKSSHHSLCKIFAHVVAAACHRRNGLCLALDHTHAPASACYTTLYSYNRGWDSETTQGIDFQARTRFHSPAPACGSARVWQVANAPLLPECPALQLHGKPLGRKPRHDFRFGIPPNSPQDPLVHGQSLIPDKPLQHLEVASAGCSLA